jgi:hypothetical protein
MQSICRGHYEHSEYTECPQKKKRRVHNSLIYRRILIIQGASTKTLYPNIFFNYQLR